MRLLAVVCLIGGCIADRSVPCGSLTCPVGEVCASGSICATPANVAACAGASDHDPCTSSTIADGACGSGACHPIACGDGIVDPGEVCDPPDPGHGCSADCRSNEACGNGIVDVEVGEECDDGNLRSSDGCASHCKLESPTWRDATPQSLTPRSDVAMVYDVDRQTIVLFGGYSSTATMGDTWELDGATAQWQPRTPITSPPARLHAAIAYDRARRQTIMFGGFGTAGSLDDTWTWDGTNWTELHPAVSPPARAYSAAAYDIARGRIVLFGGQTETQQLADTWEWNGTTWKQIAPASAPGARSYHAMAYDAANKRVVLYGGSQYNFSNLTDTWQYNGTTWTQLTPTTTPDLSFASSMTFDTVKQQVVMFGGGLATIQGNTADSNTVWYWTGTNWINGGAGTPPARAWDNVTFDEVRARLVVFGGFGDASATNLNDTWLLHGTVWSQGSIAATSPSPRFYGAATFDAAHGDVLLFGGTTDFARSVLQNDTWRWNGSVWAQITTTTPPSPRAQLAMAYDRVRARAVLFGGFTAVGAAGDTWEFDGASWLQRSSTTSPPGRSDHMLAFETARARTLLFGGFSGSGPSPDLADSWEWDGTNWTQLHPATSPPARSDAAFAYDEKRQRVVMFGGVVLAQNNDLADTWEWDGTDWTELKPAVSPAARNSAGMAYDPQRERVVLFGGSSLAPLADTWEWDGTTWTQLAPRVAAIERSGPALVYDAVRRELVLFGGGTGGPLNANTSALDWQSSLPSERCVLASDDADQDGLLGCADPDCWARCSPWCPPDTSCPANAPQCGDGVCSPVEDRAICPQDCP